MQAEAVHHSQGVDVPEYLISFNDEWVAEHTPEQIDGKATASRALIQEMREAGVLLFANGALDRSTVLCSVRAADGEPGRRWGKGRAAAWGSAPP